MTGRADVRAAVANWIGGGAVTNLTTVYTSFQKVIPGTAFTATPGQVSGAVATVFIASQQERREALGGAHSGWKKVDYDVEIHLFFRSTAPEADTAMDDFDVLVESLNARIRADRNLGLTAAQIFVAGETLSSRFGEPELSQDATIIWGAVEVPVSQFVQT